MATQPLPLNLIVDVHTTIQASSPGTAAFDVTMIVDLENVLNTGTGTNPIVPQIRTYSSLSEMGADGFKSYHLAYRTVEALFAQENRPSSVKIAGFPFVSGMDIGDFLSAVESADPAWYGVMLDYFANDGNVSVTTPILDMAGWCQTTANEPHIVFFDTARVIDKTTSSNLFSTLKSLDASRSSGFWHKGIDGAYALTLSQEFFTGCTAQGAINGAPFTAAYTTDSDTTLAALATALGALNTVGSAFVLDDGVSGANRTIILFASLANERMVLSDFTVTGGHTTAGLESNPTGVFGLAGQTFKLLTFSDSLVTANVINLSINNNAISPVTFASSNDATVAAVAAALAGLTGVGSASVIQNGSADHSILLTSLADSARLDLTAGAVTAGASQATIAYTDVQTQPDYSVCAAIVGECIASIPGTQAWSNRLLTLVGADALSTTEYNAILANNGNVYAAFSQQKKATRIGTTASGLTIRNRVLVDALDQAIQNAVFEALQTTQLTPYTDAGIQAIVGVVNGVGQSFVSSGALASFSATGPKRSAVSPADVTAGVLNNVTYSALSAGEIQKVNIKGTLTV